MPTVSLTELRGAMEWVSDNIADSEAYVCRQTGKIFWISGDAGILDQEDEVPDDIHDVGKYAPIPDKYELDIGTKLVFDFAAHHLAGQYDDIRSNFRSKGAYRRFKILLERRGALEKWHAYSEEQTIKALELWCESQGLGFEN